VRRAVRVVTERPIVAALAGPLLIVAGVVTILNGFVFRGLLTTSDVLRFWLPTYCYLGKSLASGHIPAWDPYVMGGVPFAADPQSGWMYLPAMLLFTALPCGVAIRMMIVLQPILAGLGIYWFARNERLSRVAATTTGLVLALVISESRLALSLPFAGTLAWSALSLACCSKYVHASGWQRRLLWGGATSAAWGQLAAAHFSVGLVIGSGVILTYMAVVARENTREGTWSMRGALLIGGLLAVMAVLINLAYLVPRLAYLPETSLSLGYTKLDALGTQLAGIHPRPPPLGGAAGPTWPLKLATTWGAFAGGVALAILLAGLRIRARRTLVLGLCSFGAVCYVLSLGVVARNLPDSLRSLRPVDLYLHNPQWFGYGLILVIAILAGLGVDGWRDRSASPRRFVVLLPPAVVWFALPPLFGAGGFTLLALGLGAVLAAGVLLAAARSPGAAILVPVLLFVQLTANGVLRAPAADDLFQPIPDLLTALDQPSVRASDFEHAGPIELAIIQTDRGRSITVARRAGSEPVLGDVSGLESNHSLLFGTEAVDSFDPLQLLRFWVYVRAVQHRDIKYNRSQFVDLVPTAIDLLQVRWIATQADLPPLPGLVEAAREHGWTLYELTDAAPRASLVASWQVVPSSAAVYPNAGLSLVTAQGFDASREVFLEEDPGLGAPPSGLSAPVDPAQATATYQSLGPQKDLLRTESSVPAIAVVRNVYDRNWHATVDGRPAPLLRADYLIQGIPVPAGSHVVVLTYDDPHVGYGLLGSALSIGALMGLMFALRRRRVREAGHGARA
jgi:hypothetical protein